MDNWLVYPILLGVFAICLLLIRGVLMGLLQRLLGDSTSGGKKPRIRAPNKSADEREKMQRVRFLQHMRKENPSMYQEIMLKRIGAAPDKKDDFEELERMVARLKRMGLIKNPNEMAGDDTGSLLRDAIAGLGMFMQMQGRGPVIMPPPQVEYMPPPPHTEQPAIAAPSQVQQEERPMGLMERTIKAQLETKTPEEAAKWFLAQTHPTARDIVRAFCDSEDAGIPQLLDDLARQAPDFAGLIAWLKSREEWLLETVKHLRRLSPAAMGL